MFTGEYEHNVDAKNRIFVPARFRDELGDSFMVARDLRGARLKLFSLAGWKEYIAPITEQPRKISEKALRYLHRNALQVSPDAQGRILLSRELLDYAEIDRCAVIVGCSSYVEIWSRENWARELEAEDSEELSLALEEFGL